MPRVIIVMPNIANTWICSGLTDKLCLSCSLRVTLLCLQALVGHCEAWRANFTGLLNSIALKELQALHDYFQTNTAALRQSPTTLDMLAEAVQLHKKLSQEKPAIQARFEPLSEKYRTLEKFEVRHIAGLYLVCQLVCCCPALLCIRVLQFLDVV